MRAHARRTIGAALVWLTMAATMGTTPARAEVCPPFYPYLTQDVFVWVCAEPSQGSPLFNLIVWNDGTEIAEVFVQPADGAAEVWVRVHEGQPVSVTADLYRSPTGPTVVQICVFTRGELDRCVFRELPL